LLVRSFNPPIHHAPGKQVLGLCPGCGTPIQRIQYASNEANYCRQCRTGGKLLADRGLSRLLKDDWPNSLEQRERMKADRRMGG